jgi:hypothetical protein
MGCMSCPYNCLYGKIEVLHTAPICGLYMPLTLHGTLRKMVKEGNLDNLQQQSNMWCRFVRHFAKQFHTKPEALAQLQARTRFPTVHLSNTPTPPKPPFLLAHALPLGSLPSPPSLPVARILSGCAPAAVPDLQPPVSPIPPSFLGPLLLWLVVRAFLRCSAARNPSPSAHLSVVRVGVGVQGAGAMRVVPVRWLVLCARARWTWTRVRWGHLCSWLDYRSSFIAL